MTRVTFIGHASVEVQSSSKSVLIDPWIDENPASTTKTGDYKPDGIVLTHGHWDHIADAVPLAKTHNCPLVAIYELAGYCGEQGAPNAIGMGCGGVTQYDFGKVKYVPAFHSSSHDGVYLGQACGVVLTTEDNAKIYHAGDTALFSDMALIGKENLDVAILPIGSHFTMDPEDAVDAVELLKPKYVIPVHYNTFPPIEQDVQAFKQAVEGRTSSQVIILNPGESHTF